jgi:hypothetical protein
MPILASDFKVYKAVEMNDNPTNGGYMSASLSVTTVKNNIFPDVGNMEREAGSTKYRKVFWKIENADNLSFLLARTYISLYTTGADYVTMFAGTQRDAQATITGLERQYGATALTNDITVGATTFITSTEDADMDVIQTGDSIFITDNIHEEFHDNVTVVKSAKQLTITLNAGDQIGDNFDNANTIVTSICPRGSIETSSDNWNVTSVSGLLDVATYPPILNNKGTIEQDWTFYFTSATQFNCVGNTVGAVGVGMTTVDFEPINTAMGAIYFKFNHLALSGTYASGDIVTGTTHPASTAIWFKRVVPPNAASSANSFKHSIIGESA